MEPADVFLGAVIIMNSEVMNLLERDEISTTIAASLLLIKAIDLTDPDFYDKFHDLLEKGDEVGLGAFLDYELSGDKLKEKTLAFIKRKGSIRTVSYDGMNP